MSDPRASAIVETFASAIEPNRRILDIGAGKGLLAEEMTRRFNARVTLMDVAKYNQSALPLTVCDSRTLAFADNSFDYALLSFVLHHSPNPDQMMREALRVARHVIVIENDVRGTLRGWLTQALDSWPAIQYGTPPCYFTRSRERWLAWFAQFPVQVHLLREFSLEHGFFHNVTILLTKRNES